MESNDGRVRIELGGEIAILGPKGRVERFETAKAAALLGHLAERHPRPCSREELIALVWPTVDLSAGRNSLSVALTALRRAFARVTDRAILTADRQQIGLAPEEVRVENLPAEAAETPDEGLVGREREISRLRLLLQDPDSRFVTIVAGGGIGKTTLARAALEEMTGFRVIWIEMQEASTEGRFLQALGVALGVGGGARLTDLLSAATRSGPCLLVLDAFEYFNGDGPCLIDELLKRPSLKVLATSRRPIDAERERLLRLSPLSCAAARKGSDAARLFQRLLAAHGAEVPEADIESVCQRLDGIPLGLEWAAHHVAQYGFEAIGRALSQFGSASGQLPWQDAISWTFRHVSSEARSLWLWLALNSCPVAHDVLSREHLALPLPELLRHGVVSLEIDEGVSYVRMLDTFSEIGLALAPPEELETARESHTSVWAEWCRHAGWRLRGPDPVGTVVKIAAMLPGVIEHLRLAPLEVWHESFLSLHPFFRIFGMPNEVCDGAEERCQAENPSLKAQARSLAIAAFCCHLRHPERYAELAERAMGAALESGCRETLLIATALAYRLGGEERTARVEKAIEAGEESPWHLAARFEFVAVSTVGQPAGTGQKFEGVLRSAKKAGFLLMEFWCLVEFGYAQLVLSRLREAEATLQRASALRQSFGCGSDIARSLLAMTHNMRGNGEAAIAINREILEAPHNLMWPYLRSHVAERLLNLYLDTGRVAEADAAWESCMEAMLATPEDYVRIGLALLYIRRDRIAGDLDAALARCQALDQALEEKEGDLWRPHYEDLLRFERSLCLAMCGDPESAMAEVVPTLVRAIDGGRTPVVVRSLEALAFAFQEKGDLNEAALLLHAAESLMESTGIGRLPARRALLAPSFEAAGRG